MNGPLHSRFIIRSAPFGVGLGLLLVLRATACGPGPNDLIDDHFDRQALLQQLVDKVVLPDLKAFSAAAEELKVATADLAAAELNQSLSVAEKKEAAQAAWRSAAAAWQHIELLQFGPTGASGVRVGGQNFRDEVYSWPTANPCRVDQELVKQQYNQSTFFTNNLVNVYGLDALEYLLFFDGTSNACSPLDTINQDGSWAALSDDEKALRRATYAARAAEHLLQNARALYDAWAPEAGNFAAQMVNAGQEGSPFASQREALDEILSASFYLNNVLQDLKIGRALGLSTCSQTPCVESRWAQHSAENILANLQSFQRLFCGEGQDGLGFDDFLVARNAYALAEALAAECEQAISAAEQISPNLSEALSSKPSSVQALYDAVKTLSARLKHDVPAALLLSVPDEAAGDAD